MNATLAAALLAACTAAAAARAENLPATFDLGWINGHWCGGSGARRIEEYWMSPAGGVLLGLSRTLQAERVANFEFMRIVVEDGVPSYIVSPNGGSPVVFKRTAGDSDWVRFENPQHDFPRSVEYRLRGSALHAEIAGPGADGKALVIPFDYEPCASY